jgi:hypothetical protein
MRTGLCEQAGIEWIFIARGAAQWSAAKREHRREKAPLSGHHCFECEIAGQ